VLCPAQLSGASHTLATNGLIGINSYITAIDLALSVVIIFLLGAVTVRALFFVHDQAELGLFRRYGKRPPEGNLRA
jgi:hypothetical protein